MIAPQKPNNAEYARSPEKLPYALRKSGKNILITNMTPPSKTRTARFVRRKREILLRKVNISTKWIYKFEVI